MSDTDPNLLQKAFENQGSPAPQSLIPAIPQRDPVSYYECGLTVIVGKSWSHIKQTVLENCYGKPVFSEFLHPVVLEDLDDWDAPGSRSRDLLGRIIGFSSRALIRLVVVRNLEQAWSPFEESVVDKLRANLQCNVNFKFERVYLGSSAPTARPKIAPKYTADFLIQEALEETLDISAEAEDPQVADFFACVALFLTQYRRNGGFKKEHE